jgi:hypothetical protein
MTTADTPPRIDGAATTTQGGRLTASFLVRQFILLGIMGTCLLAMLFFYDLYGLFKWSNFWELGYVSFKWISLPTIVVIVYGYVLIIGVLFALVPSERSFQFFFYGIALALFFVNYDHTMLDWLLQAVFSATLAVPNPISVFKIAIATILLGALAYMHYNILSDDFTKRMIRRGIPTEEAARIRPAMIASLLPLLTVCAAIAVGLGLVGEFSQLVFRDHGLFPKIEILLLGVFGVAIGFLLRSIIKELYQGGGDDEDEFDLAPDPEPERPAE